MVSVWCERWPVQLVTLEEMLDLVKNNEALERDSGPFASGRQTANY